MSDKRWKVGFIGLGKLGLPVATAMALRGADVMGYDVNSKRMSYEKQPYLETGPDGTDDFNDWLHVAGSATTSGAVTHYAGETFRGALRFGSIDEVVRHADVIFVAVQTPHDMRFEGITPLKDEPCDFDYSFLRSAVISAVQAKAREASDRMIPVVVISTVLPGTMEREIIPQLTPDLPLVYNPSFIAMGTTMRDFLDPEFILLGVKSTAAADVVRSFYEAILPDVARRFMSIPSAELSKIMYNTALSQKVALANAVMEICHKIPGANCDDVTGAMKASFRRVTGAAYMDGGMGDGGGCHPRDNIAMMWLAKILRLSHDPFTPAMVGREKQSAWLRSLIMHNLPPGGEITIMGYAYKPGTNITIGSPGLLLASQIEALGNWKIHLHDIHVDPDDLMRPIVPSDKPAVVFVGCRHPEYWGWTGVGLPEGSVIIDPFRYLGPPVKGVRLIQVGVGTHELAWQTVGGESQQPAPIDSHFIEDIIKAETKRG